MAKDSTVEQDWVNPWERAARKREDNRRRRKTLPTESLSTKTTGFAVDRREEWIKRERQVARDHRPDLVRCYGERCLRCGWTETQALVVDHIIPLCRQGTSAIDNLQLLCLNCNFIKGRRLIDYRPFPISQEK